MPRIPRRRHSSGRSDTNRLTLTPLVLDIPLERPRVGWNNAEVGLCLDTRGRYLLDEMQEVVRREADETRGDLDGVKAPFPARSTAPTQCALHRRLARGAVPQSSCSAATPSGNPPCDRAIPDGLMVGIRARYTGDVPC